MDRPYRRDKMTQNFCMVTLTLISVDYIVIVFGPFAGVLCMYLVLPYLHFV